MRRMSRYDPKRTWAAFEGHQQAILERTHMPRLVVLTGLLVLCLVMLFTSGCATVERWTDEHPEVVAGASVAVLAVGGVVLAKGIAKSGRTQVVAQPRTTLGPP